MSEYKTLKDINIKGKFVLIRAGLDVPLDPKKDLLNPERVTDDTRIKDILPTLEYAIKEDAKVILAAGWCGRPKGEEPDYSMAPVAKRLELLLKQKNVLKYPVLIAPDCFKDKKPKSVYKNKVEVKKIVDSLKPAQVVILENVRYDLEANANDKDFAAFFASLANIYVNENETQNHRPEATIVTTPMLIAQKGGEVVYGFKYRDVLENIGKLKNKLEDKQRGHFVFGLCGKKIESDPGITSKITVGLELIDKMNAGDAVITGGAVTYTFLLAQHYADRIKANLSKVNQIVKEYDEKIITQTNGMKDKEKAETLTADLQKQKSEELKKLLSITDTEIESLIGDSYIRWGQEGEQIVFAYNVIAKAKFKGVDVITAFDHTITNMKPDKSGMLPKEAEVKLFDKPTGIPQGWLGVGEGPKTLAKISAAIEKAWIYLQSGPYSIEDDRVEHVSKTDHITFQAVKKCKQNGGITIGAGGDTTAKINVRKTEDCFSIITSAGGATLELIQSGTSTGKEAVEAALRNYTSGL